MAHYSAATTVDDLVLLSGPTNETIMDTLRRRLERGSIYTYIGHVLIAMNPYRMLDIYGDKNIEQCIGCYRHELAPHVYMVAEDAFRTMVTEEESQCIIISGESGAGKTESAKFIMKYIAAVSKHGAGVEETKRIVLGSNPLLEAFGNAKTLRNNNSSRFGKYVQMTFDGFGTPKGGLIRNYLLEKSRVVHQSKGERNFHVFYQLLLGSDDSIRSALKLTSPKDFHYLNRSGCITVEGTNEAEDFAELRTAMDMVGLSSKAVEAVLKLVASVLHLGNVDFAEHGQGSHITTEGSLKIACGLLGLDAAALAHALCFRHIKTRDEEFESPQNPVQACAARDALAKSLYARLFDWLVSCVNDALAGEESSTDLLSINVLDIYGFEVFDNNGFEQFLINYVNEKLQQIFIDLTLQSEQEEYKSEGIAWTPIAFFNNKIVCELIESKRPPGVLCILDDVCATVHAQSTGADDKFIQKSAEFHSSHAHFKAAGRGFVVQHYAGPVEYNKNGFCGANKDSLIVDLLSVVKQSTVKFVRALFPESVDQDTKKPSSVGFKMKEQCAQLVDALMACNPHYVRCIKPNDEKKAGVVDGLRVVHQVKYLGLLENIRVRVAGFAYRQEFHRFNERYKILVPTSKRKGATDKDICIAMLKYLMSDLKLEKNEIQVGRTKLFLKKPETLQLAENLREERCVTAARTIQQAYRRYKLGEHLIKLRRTTNTYITKHKRRRRESLIRPFVCDYLHFTSSRGEALRKCMEDLYFTAVEHMVFTDTARYVHLPVPTTGRVTEINVSCVLSNTALYFVEHVSTPGLPPLQNGRPHPLLSFTRLRRRIPLTFIKALSLSQLADNYMVIHCKPRPPVQPEPWVPDSKAPSCTVCDTGFGWFTRRHHCRQCGRVCCYACCPEGQGTVPDRGLLDPVRICLHCVGKEACDIWGDCVISTFHKSELMAHISDQIRTSGGSNVTINFSPSITVEAQVYRPETKALAPVSVTLTFEESATMPVDNPGVIVRAQPTSLAIQSPTGVPDEVIAGVKKREQRRWQRREQQRAEEQEQRRILEEQRQLQREAERKERIRAKKEKKAADRRAKQEQEEAVQASAAIKAAKKAGIKPPVAAKSAASSAPACGTCGCNDYTPHPFKKPSCANCFHLHT